MGIALKAPSLGNATKEGKPNPGRIELRAAASNQEAAPSGGLMQLSHGTFRNSPPRASSGCRHYHAGLTVSEALLQGLQH